MLIGCRELIDLCAATADDCGWIDRPSEATIAACWAEARELAGKFPSAADETAAVFYAVSRNVGGLRDAVEFPPVVMLHQASLNGLDIGLASLTDVWRLQSDIDDGMPFEDVRRWFETHLTKGRARL